MKIKFLEFKMVNCEICPNCGSPYDGSYCSCHENDLGD